MIRQRARFQFTVMLACVTVAAASEATGRAQFRADANVVLVGATVLDRHNRVVRGLTQADFHLFEDAAEQRIVYFGEDDLPVSLAIVFDTSGSMEGKLSNTRGALAALLETSNPEDEFCLITFADRPKIAVPWSTSQGEIRDRVLSIRSNGRTALLDAVQMGIEQLRRSRNPRRALVIFSDGGDNYSRITERRLAGLLEEADVQMYAVNMMPPDAGWGADRAPEEIVGQNLLAELCERASGRYFPLDGQRDLKKVADQIGKELRSQYVLGYTPTRPARDGKFHRVQLKLLRGAGGQKLSVYWRRGYRAPSN
jgi:Ca-activated chloride channel family protein